MKEPVTWIQYLHINRPMLEDAIHHLRKERVSAQSDLDSAIDKSDWSGATRAKGRRDAFDQLLHSISPTVEGL